MEESVLMSNPQIWFGQGAAVAGKLLVVIAGDEQRAMIADSLTGIAASGVTVEACRPDGVGAQAAQLLSAADGVVFVTGASNRLDNGFRYHVGQAASLGPSRLFLIVTGLDETQASQALCEQMGEEFAQVVEGLGIEQTHVVPMTSGEAGVQVPSWYHGAALDEMLVSVLEATDRSGDSLRAVVLDSQSGPDQISARIMAGDVAAGDAVKILPGARQFEIVSLDKQAGSAEVVLTTNAAHGAVAGNIVCSAGDPVLVSDQFETNVVWFGPEPMLPGRPYFMQFAAGTIEGNFANPKHVINLETLEHLAAKTLEPGDIGVCNLSLEADVPFAPYREFRALGGFSIVDKFTDQVVGAGAVNFALRRASNIHWQALDLNKGTRSGKLGQKPSVLWFTGLSGSGKSTIANLVEKKLYAMGHQTYLLDGDNVRHGLNRDLGFTDADRVENIRRVAEVAKLMADAGLIVLASFISPFKSERRMARDMMDDGEFLEVYVETPLEVCEQRDVKGLYVKARRGEIKNFTGIDSDYELPELAEIILDTVKLDAEQSADEIIAYLQQTGRLNP